MREKTAEPRKKLRLCPLLRKKLKTRTEAIHLPLNIHDRISIIAKHYGIGTKSKTIALLVVGNRKINNTIELKEEIIKIINKSWNEDYINKLITEEKIKALEKKLNESVNEKKLINKATRQINSCYHEILDMVNSGDDYITLRSNIRKLKDLMLTKNNLCGQEGLTQRQSDIIMRLSESLVDMDSLIESAKQFKNDCRNIKEFTTAIIDIMSEERIPKRLPQNEKARVNG